MSARKELEKLQAMRAKLEEESRSLREQQNNLENSVLSLEEEVATEQLNKEKALIEELKEINNATKHAISKLEARRRELETQLEQPPQEPATPSAEEEKEEAPAQPEEAEESGVTVTAIESEALVASPEATGESPKKQEKKKRRFF